MIRYGKPSISVYMVALVATAVVGSAFAEMVYDDDAAPTASAQQMSAAPTKVEVQNNVITSEPVSTAPVVAEAPKLQKVSEQSRDKRNFQESMNNELVVQKLEERRLKQEEKLTSEINKRFTIEQDEPAGSVAPVMKEEAIVKPITETPGTAAAASYSMSAAPKAAAPVTQPIVQDQVATYQSSSSMSAAPVVGHSTSMEPSVKSDGEKPKSGGVSIIPKAGLSTLLNSQYNINPKFMAGVGIGFDVSDHVGVEIGYAYSELGVRGAMPYGMYQPINELQFKNNTFDLGMKLYLTGLDAKVRPFIGGGMAYSTGYINYDDRYQQMAMMYGQWNQSQDYTLNQFQAMGTVGIDFKVASNISFGAAYKFLKPLASSVSENGFYNGYFYGQPIDPAKQALRGTLQNSDMSVFQVSASVTF